MAFVHIFLFIAPSSLQGGFTSVFNVAAYGILLLLYAVLRGRKALLDKRRHETAPSEG